MHVPEKKRKKMDDRGEKLDMKSKANRLYNLISKKVIISKDVEFMKNTIGAGPTKKNMLEACSSIMKMMSYGK